MMLQKSQSNLMMPYHTDSEYEGNTTDETINYNTETPGNIFNRDNDYYQNQISNDDIMDGNIMDGNETVPENNGDSSDDNQLYQKQDTIGDELNI